MEYMPTPKGIVEFSGVNCYFPDGRQMITMDSENMFLLNAKRLVAKLLYGAAVSGTSELWYYTIGSGTSASYASMYKPEAEHTDGWTDMSATRTRSDTTLLFNISAPSGIYTGSWGEIVVFTKSGEATLRSTFPSFIKAGDGAITGKYRLII